MKMDEDINNFVPSLLFPRTVPKKSNGELLTQTSVVSRCSLSLKRKNNYVKAKENPKKDTTKMLAESLTNKENFVTHQNAPAATKTKNIVIHKDKNHLSLDKTTERIAPTPAKNIVITKDTNILSQDKTIDNCTSIGFSAIEDLQNVDTSPVSLSFEHFSEKKDCHNDWGKSFNPRLKSPTLSSATDLIEDISEKDSRSTETYSLIEKPSVSVSFGLIDSTFFTIDTKNNIKNLSVKVKDNITNVDLEIVEGSQQSQVLLCKSEKIEEESFTKDIISSPKKLPAAVNLEIKKKLREDSDANSLGATENSKVLILNTSNARLSHVIVQPPNYNLTKRQIPNARNLINSGKKRRISVAQNVQCKNRLKQSRIDQFLVKKSDDTFHDKLERICYVNGNCSEDVASDGEVMSRNPVTCIKCDQHRVRSSKEIESPRVIRVQTARRESPKHVKSSTSDAQRIKSADSSRRYDSHQFSLPSKTASRQVRTVPAPNEIPPFKILAGTHFAVDAFSYGEIPNVKHYFLTHFHSDHYAGLKKTFNKILFCSKITAELCVARLGVNAKTIRIISFDETFTVENVEVTAIDANHCPGALMLVFTLPTGKTILHTGDFRASPQMESYPIFWNKEIHTVYLDTTYCNPRYDFPTQDQSLEMALYLLREKKIALEQAGKKFSSVLIICGTYTIGKEKFFLGMARRVGCSVWACPEKDRVLQAVEGRSFSHAPPQSCQLHVVPMRDLTHEKLHEYLTSLQGAFTEVVAFKPSGWENGKNQSSTRDSVTIHGVEPFQTHRTPGHTPGGTLGLKLSSTTNEHSSFSEMIRFVKFLKPKQVVPTVDISGGIKSVQKFFPCPLVVKESTQMQSKLNFQRGSIASQLGEM